MTAFQRRYYDGAGSTTVLSSSMANTDTTFNISSANGWPGSPGVPFFVVIDRGTASEEKVLCASNASTVVTVSGGTGGRGQDGTSAVSHNSGATVSLCITALDADEWNQISYLLGNLASGSIIQGAGAGTIPTATAITGSVADTASTQTLTNKTLTAPKIATISNTGTLTLPTSSDTLVGRATTDTLTNKRVTKRVLALSANSATPAINTDNYDVVHITGQSAAITSFTSGLTGTPVDGDTLRISITGTGAVALTWGASFESSTVSLPTTTVTTARLDVGFFWNTETSKWRCMGAA